MKQLKKLGSQGSRVLTEGQMRNIQGGKALNSCAKGPWLCATDACEVVDASGKVSIGMCTLECVCMIQVFPPDPELPLDPGPVN